MLIILRIMKTPLSHPKLNPKLAKSCLGGVVAEVLHLTTSGWMQHAGAELVESQDGGFTV